MGDASLQSFLSDDEGFEILDTSPSMEFLSLRNGGAVCLKTDTVESSVPAPKKPVTNGDNGQDDAVFRSFRAPELNNFIRDPELTESQFASMSSVRSSIYQGEIPERLSALLQENKELKDTLQKNNAAMRDQFILLMGWQGKVKEMQIEHKQKVLQTKELLKNLKLENAELKKNSMASSLEFDLRTENEVLKKKLETFVKDALQKSSQAGLHDSSEEIQKAQHSLKQVSIENERVAGQLSRVLAHVDSLTEEKGELEKELEKARQENKELIERKQELEEKVSSFKINVGKLSIECHQAKTLAVDLRAEEQLRREELRATLNQLAELQAEKNAFEIINNTISTASSLNSTETTRQNKLEEEIQRFRCQFESTQEELKTVQRDLEATQKENETVPKVLKHLRSQLLAAQADKITMSFKPLELTQEISMDESMTSLVRKVNLYEKYLNNVVDVYNQQSKRQAYLQHHIDGALAVIAANDIVHEELTALQQMAMKSQSEIVSEREKLVDAQNHFQSIFQEFKLLTTELQENKSGSEAAAIATKNMLQEQKRKFEEEFDALHAQLMASKEAVIQKEQDRVKVMEELVMVKQQNESIDVLKAQLELYKTDFNQERTQRQNIAIEREQLAEDLRLLQRRNESLIKEVQEARSAEGATGPHPTAASAPPPAQSPRRSASPEAALRFTCPMCFERFRTYHILQEHVENCGDII